MNILLVQPQSERVPVLRTYYMPPLGLLSIGASIKKYHPSSCVKILNGELIDEQELFNAIYNTNFDLLGISTNVGCYRSALHIAKKVKSQFRKVLIVFGGHYISALWKECLKNRNYIDCCVVGDGEFPMVEICQGKPLSRTAGIATQDSFCEPKYYNLDKYPDPDWSLIDLKPYQDAYREIYNFPRATVASINSQKGCMWREKTGGCIFCGLIHPHFRMRSPKRVWNEIGQLNKSFGCNHFWEVSDSICANLEWLKEFSDLKPSGMKPYFRGYARATEITPTSAQLLKKIGFHEMFIGVESGDNSRLKAANKGSTVKTNLRATTILANNGIKTFASIVLGLPGESVDSLKKTYNHVLKLFDYGLFTLSVCIFTPYPGSPAFTLLLNHKTVGPQYRNQDVFNWRPLAEAWIENFCECSFSDIMDFSGKFQSLKNCLYEDNFTYVDRKYDI